MKMYLLTTFISLLAVASAANPIADLTAAFENDVRTSVSSNLYYSVLHWETAQKSIKIIQSSLATINSIIHSEENEQPPAELAATWLEEEITDFLIPAGTLLNGAYKMCKKMWEFDTYVTEKPPTVYEGRLDEMMRWMVKGKEGVDMARAYIQKAKGESNVEDFINYERDTQLQELLGSMSPYLNGIDTTATGMRTEQGDNGENTMGRGGENV